MKIPSYSRGIFNFTPAGNGAETGGKNPPPLAQSGRVWAALTRGWGEVRGGRRISQGVGVGSGGDVATA